MFSGFEVHVVNYPINNEAPFNIIKNKNIFFYKRSEFKSSYEINNSIKKIKPGAIFISGWLDKDYLKVVRNSSFKFKKILMIDNQWRDTFFQNLWAIYFKFFLKSTFNCICSGLPQTNMQ